RRREDHGQESLRVVEDEEGELLAAPAAPALAELSVARVLAVPEASDDDPCDAQRLDPGGGGDQRTMLDPAGPERAVDPSLEGDRDAPARVDERGVAGPALDEIERH